MRDVDAIGSTRHLQNNFAEFARQFVGLDRTRSRCALKVALRIFENPFGRILCAIAAIHPWPAEPSLFLNSGQNMWINF